LAPEAVKVKTPEATIGFRGTRCLIKVEDNLTTFTGVKVDKGKGDHLYSMPLTTPGFPDDHYSYNSVATSPGVEVDKGKDYVSDYSYSYSSPAEPPVVPSDQDGWPTNSKIVLVPEDDGKVGEISVATFAGAQILNKPWEATELVSPNALPSAPKVMDEAEVKNIFKEALAALPIPSIIHIIYFESGNAALTSGSLQAVQEIIEEIKSQKSNQIMVLGYTDTVGAVEYNRKLSQRRAKSVADVLVSKGVEDAIIEIEYYGKEGLFIKTPDGVNEPRNRRVEIIVR
jgi:outer membrane protein OmpA-like peptidoglycan-associated protein